MKTMKKSMPISTKATAVVSTVAVVVFATVLLKFASGQLANTNPPLGQAPPSNAPPSEASVDLKPSQLAAIKIETVSTYVFSMEKTALGSIDYDEDLSVQV